MKLLAAILSFVLFVSVAFANTLTGPSGCGGVSFSLGSLTGGIGCNSGPPPTSCASTGIFDLSNVCNDIYFIGALK